MGLLVELVVRTLFKFVAIGIQAHKFIIGDFFCFSQMYINLSWLRLGLPSWFVSGWFLWIQWSFGYICIRWDYWTLSLRKCTVPGCFNFLLWEYHIAAVRDILWVPGDWKSRIHPSVDSRRSKFPVPSMGPCFCDSGGWPDCSHCGCDNALRPSWIWNIYPFFWLIS